MDRCVRACQCHVRFGRPGPYGPVCDLCFRRMEEDRFEQQVMPLDVDRGEGCRIKPWVVQPNRRSGHGCGGNAPLNGCSRTERTWLAVPAAMPSRGAHHAVIGGRRALRRCCVILPRRRQRTHRGRDSLRHRDGQCQAGEDTGHQPVASSQHALNIAGGWLSLQRQDNRADGQSLRLRSAVRPRRLSLSKMQPFDSPASWPHPTPMRFLLPMREAIAASLLVILGATATGLPSHSHDRGATHGGDEAPVVSADHHEHGTQLVEQGDRFPTNTPQLASPHVLAVAVQHPVVKTTAPVTSYSFSPRERAPPTLGPRAPPSQT